MLRPLFLAILLCLPGSPAAAHLSAWSESSSVDDGEKPGRSTAREDGNPRHLALYPASSPVVLNSIPDQTYSLGAGSFTIDLADVFSDTDGNRLTFSASSNDTDVATTEVDGSILTVTLRDDGNCRIRTTAKDDRNQKADDTFTLIVRKNQPPTIAPEVTLDDQTLYSGGAPLILNLSNIFLDPDGDNLTYSAESGRNDIAFVAVEDAILTITPNARGETEISLSASDQNGGVIRRTFSVQVLEGYPSVLSAEIHVTFGDYRDQGSYRMVALPGDQTIALNRTVSGSANLDWVAFAPDTSGSGQLIAYDRSDLFELRPGRGLWFLSKKDWQQTQGTVSTVPINGQGSFEIPLHEGWNIIANPFDRDIPWSVIADINQISQGIWRWDHGYELSETFHATFFKQEAYYFNNIEGLENLSIPYPFSVSTITPSKQVPEVIQQVVSQTRVEVAGEAAGTTTAVSIVWDSNASDGFDRFDQFAPPMHFNPLQLSIYPSHPDFEALPLAVESRPSANLHRFELQVDAAASDWVTFTLQALQIPPGAQTMLVNLLDAKTYDLQAGHPQKIEIDAGVTPFTLFIGEWNEMEKELESLTPAAFSLKQNYPNPFSPATTIEYAIPTAQYVNLSVYDIMGRHLITLHQGEMAAGLHQVRWNGRDRFQNRVADGVYVYRLVTESWSQSHKMTLIR